MNVFLKLNPALQRNLIIFFGASLCFWGGLAGMLPNLALYIGSFGASNQEIGWVMAAFAAGLLCFRPRMSRLTDKKGRKPALLIGVAVIAIAPILYLAVQLAPQTTFSLPSLTLQLPIFNREISLLGWQLKSAVLLLVLVRAFHGISVAAFATAYTAAVADMAPPQHRGELISTMSLAGPLGMAMGPALGGYLAGNFTLAFLAMTAVGTAGTVCILFSQEPPRPTVEPAVSNKNLAVQLTPNQLEQAPKKSPLFWRLLFTPPIRVPALMLFMVGIAFGAMVTFVPLYVQARAWDFNIGLIYTVSAIASFSIRTFSGTASDRHGRGRFISLGITLYGLSMLVLALSTGPTTLLLAGALQGAGSGTTIPIISALMTDRAQPHERGLTFGLCLTGFDLGIALAGPLMGRIVDVTGSYALVFGFAGMMTFLGLIIFITTSSKDIPHSVRFALNDGRDVYAVKP
ncbi:MAG: MFS transporter [Cyanobacteria bacterium J06627_28]